MDPKLARELAKNSAAHAAKLNTVALRRRKAELFTKPYDKPSESLALCRKQTSGDFSSNFNQDDWIMIGKMALQRANDDLLGQAIPPITDKEAGEIATFLAANDCYIGGDGSMLVGFSILVSEGILRPQAAKVEPEPEPAVEEPNPYRWDDNPRSEYAQFEMNRYREARHQEMQERTVSPILSAASQSIANSSGKRFTLEDQTTLATALATGAYGVESVHNYRKAAIALWGASNVGLLPDEIAAQEDVALSSEEMKKKYGYTVSFDLNRGRQAVRQ